MTKTIRKLAAQNPLLETGAIQFGKEPPGVYFTGENASYCALILSRIIPLCSEATGLLPAQLQGIVDILLSAKPAKTESIHSSLTKNILDEAIHTIESVNVYATQQTFKSAKEALIYQADRVTQVLRALKEHA